MKVDTIVGKAWLAGSWNARTDMEKAWRVWRSLKWLDWNHGRWKGLTGLLLECENGHGKECGLPGELEAGKWWYSQDVTNGCRRS